MADRDRRPDGRPEQARPRDRTGRPLPYGTSGIPLTEEHEPRTVEEALELGFRLWADRRLFEAHECLEHVWHAAPDDDRDLWQGVIQVAVAGVHLQRDNPPGAAATFRKALRRLERYPSTYRGMAIDQLRQVCRQGATQLDATGEIEGVALPAPPEPVGEGPWFATSPEATGPAPTPTPLDRIPPWQRPPRGDTDDQPGATP